MEGRLLGNRYELIKRIGGGGMAVVYKAKCLLLNRYVAVKILRSEFIDDEEFVKRFRVEAQAAASLSHPNIVSIFDVGHEGDIHYIVMEYIDGITLKEYIDQNGGLPWRESISIAIQICSALEQAHKNNIIHRDIKPHNILLTKEGIAKVTDFGIARAVTSATITMVGSTIGSVHYFSPEQAKGSYTDEKSDLYSLGITLYEMVTGKVPFDGETPVAVALKHIQEKAERPLDANPSIPKAVNDLIIKSIKKDQNLRYQSASEMLTDLQRTLGEPNAVIAGSNVVEDLPTRKMEVVGKDIEIISDEDIYDAGLEEGENDMAKKRKKDRLGIWLGIATGLVVVGIIFYIGLKILIPVIIPEEPEGYVVLDYTDRNFNEVYEELQEYGITAVDKDRVYSDTIQKDIIISQEVAAGNKLKPGSYIDFEVSNGVQLVEVPDIIGQESRMGEQLVRNQQLVPKIITENSETVGTGLIIKTEPAAFEKLRPEEAVTIYVSLGPLLKKVKVPDLLGHTRAEAEKLLEDNGLTIGEITPSDVISEVAKIIDQYPAPQAEVDEGTGVDMTFKVDDGTGQTGENGNGAGGDEGETREHFLKISLNPNHSYGEEVLVYIEITPSDTNVTNVLFNQTIAKSSFPFSYEIDLPKNSTAHVIVKLDGILAQEGDI